MIKDLKDFCIKLITSRLFLLVIVFLGLFALLISRLFQLQIVEGAQHLKSFEYKSEKNLELTSARGNIYDKNGVLLAYNKLAYKVTYDNSTSFEEVAANNDTTKNYEMNKALSELIIMLESNGDEIINDFPITMTTKGQFKFTTDSISTLKRFRSEVFKIETNKKLSKIEEKQMKSTAKEVFDYLCTGKGSSNPEKIKGYDISSEYADEIALKIMAIRYNINLNRYTQYNSVTIAMDISDKSVALITENKDIYRGADVVADSLRVYKDSKYFASIIGYTGIASTDELDSLNKDKLEEDGDYYSNNDVVGKSGLEQEMEAYLRGTKGSRKVFVNNLGKVLEEVDKKDAKAGNNVYLTIDSKLQKYAYDTLEQRLAGILYHHLTSDSSTGTSKNRLLPINEVYFALIDNNVVDITKFSSKKATDNEKNIHKKLLSKKKSTINKIKTKLQDTKVPIKDQSDEYKEYMLYIADILNKNNVLMTSSIEANDKVKVNWDKGKISLGEYLHYAIQNSWIDVSGFDISNDFYDIDTIYVELLKYIENELKNDTEFDKLLYKYMIKQGNLSGKEVCMTLYNQKVLNSKKDKDYDKLVNGTYSAYTFMKEKIKKLDITPAQLALDPCSGSIVVTDPKNGNVLALVSYPSYDNNKLANSVDSDYFNKLIVDKSKPMLFRATQSKTAPGSTFKPVTSAAILEENTISTGTVIKCTGSYDKVTPTANCWIAPGAHGKETIVTALEDSCNFFFFEAAYRLGSGSGTYNSETGLNKMAKYAEMFGLNKKSGIQLNESSPEISDYDAVRSSIGQGTNNFTPSQIARYVTALANKGNCYDLSILDKVENSNGKMIKDFKPKLNNKIELKESTWNSIHSGMYKVVNGGSENMTALFKANKLDVAGKTGTAQQNKKKADHALFISFAPSSKPKITVTTVVPNGYSSANAAQITSDIYKYYFNGVDKKEKVSQKVSSTIVNNNLRGD